MPEDQLLAEVIALRAEVQGLRDKVVSLGRENATLSENQLIQLQLIKQLREGARREPQPMQKDRGEILRALLVANGGKMLVKDARQKMHLRKDLFSKLLKVCDFIEVKTLSSDRRRGIIILK